jgi:hypothetical protein
MITHSRACAVLLLATFCWSSVAAKDAGSQARPQWWPGATDGPTNWAKVDRDSLGDRYVLRNDVPIRAVNFTTSFVTAKPVTLRTVPGGATCGSVSQKLDGAQMNIKLVGASIPARIELRITNGAEVIVKGESLVPMMRGAHVVWLQTDMRDKELPDYAIYLVDCSRFMVEPQGLGKYFLVEQFEDGCETHKPRFGDGYVERRFDAHICPDLTTPNTIVQQTQVGVGPEKL